MLVIDDLQAYSWIALRRISGLRVLRVFRVLRALRFKPARGIQALIVSLVRGFPLIMHVLAVLGTLRLKEVHLLLYGLAMLIMLQGFSCLSSLSSGWKQ
jgi:ABC-type amino acid transport system permease subunit